VTVGDQLVHSKLTMSGKGHGKCETDQELDAIIDRTRTEAHGRWKLAVLDVLVEGAAREPGALLHLRATKQGGFVRGLRMHGGRLLMSDDRWRNAGHGCECSRESAVRAGHSADDDGGRLLESEPGAGPDCPW
jgi:hypothetical protein